MKFLDKLFNKNDNVNWDEIKTTDKVYPSNSIVLLSVKTKSGMSGTGWADKGYDNYAYKQFCPYNFLIVVDLTDSIAENNPDLDMMTIENFFVDELKKVCVTHIVARVVTDKGMNIQMYLEKKDPAMKHLRKILDSPNRLVSFICEINKDPQWTAVSKFIN